MEYIEFTGKTVDDAITEACQKFTVTSDRLEYEVVEKGTSGIFGFAAKPAVIKARVFDPNAPKEEPKAEVKEEVKAEAKSENKAAKAEVKEEEKKDSAPVPAADPKEF
ncbi:MAG: Jag N-terminal domain-containing protein, partial [Eubacterium sp.]|nr:Jag N-terminal domain-containing protein [Eubacterium sp.]